MARFLFNTLPLPPFHLLCLNTNTHISQTRANKPQIILCLHCELSPCSWLICNDLSLHNARAVLLAADHIQRLGCNYHLHSRWVLNPRACCVWCFYCRVLLNQAMNRFSSSVTLGETVCFIRVGGCRQQLAIRSVLRGLIQLSLLHSMTLKLKDP